MTIERDNNPPYEFIDHIFVGPYKLGIIGDLAESYFEQKCYDKWWTLKFWQPFGLLGRLLGSNSKSRGELLSWLFFEPGFMKELIDMGKAHAQRRLQIARESGAFPFNNGG